MENCGITAAEGGCKPRQAPDPAAPPRADMESAPTDRGNPAANRKPLAIATHVGAHIVRPGNPAVNRKPRATATHVGAHIVRPGNPAAGRKPCVAATHVGDDARIVPGTTRYRKVPREGHDPPLQTPANARSNRRDMSLGAAVGRDALIPPDPRGGANVCGRDESRPYGPGKPRGQPQTLRRRTPHVGADSISARLVSAQGGRARDACRPPQTHTKTLRPADGSAGGAACVLGPGVLQLYSWIKTV